MTSPLKVDKQAIEWRRNQTLELSARGKSQREISIILQVSEGTTSLDMKWIRLQAQKAIEQHIQQDLPLEHQKAMSGLHQVLKMAWDLSISEADTKTKLMSLALVNDCYKLIMELSSDASIIKEAMAFVRRHKPTNTDLSNSRDREEDKPTKQEDIEISSADFIEHGKSADNNKEVEDSSNSSESVELKQSEEEEVIEE